MSGLLAGREWFTWDIVDLVGLAARKAMSTYTSLLDYAEDPETARWRDAALSLAYLKNELNQLSASDASAPSPTLYREGANLFSRVDAALSVFGGDPEILSAIGRLPVTPLSAQVAAKWPYLVALAGVAVGGYLLVKSK